MDCREWNPRATYFSIRDAAQGLRGVALFW
jgi:hypothetical protein